MAQETTAADTLPKLLRRNYLRWGDEKAAMRHKEFGIWQEYTWKDEYETVKYFCLGLMSLGFGRGDKLATIGENEPEQFFAIFACHAAGGIALSMFPDAIDPEIEYVVNHSDASFVVANDQEQVDKLLRIRERVPNVKKVIWWDPKGMWNYEDPWLLPFYEVVEMGKRYEEEHPAAFEQSIEETTPDDYATFYYTSGTTGLPKGAMLNHTSLVTTVDSICNANPVDENDGGIDYISPAWFGEPLYGSTCHLLKGIVLNFAEEPETLMTDLREIAPQVVGWGPRQWENMASLIQVRINDAPVFKRWPYRLLLPIGYKHADIEMAEEKDQPGPLARAFWKAMWWLADTMVFHALRDKLGMSGARFGIVGGYTLGADTFRYLRAIGINICQFYASTEGGFISAHYRGRAKVGTVGEVADYAEVKTNDEGELLVRSPGVFSGYYKNPDATTKALEEDGWLHTGDAVYQREDGQLVFIDRASELGELRGGLKYSPQFIESQLRFGGYIKDAMVAGDANTDYVAAIIDIDFEAVGKWAEKHQVPYTTYVDLSQKPEVAELVLRDVERVNKSVPEHARIKKFVLLHKEFDPDESELTRTRKLRRKFMADRYRGLIDAIYGDQDSYQVETSVTYQDGKKDTIKAAIRINEVKTDS